MVRIMTVEDDESLNNAVCKHLGSHGYFAIGFRNASDALDALASEKFDLIVSDVMMPKLDGFEFAKRVRELDGNIPILFMTARDDFAAKKRGFHIGIDDYMTKPINLDELLLHITALLRRAKIAADKRLEVGNLVLDEDELCATVDGENAALTLREFRILYKLLSYPKHTFTRGQLLDELCGYDADSGLRSVDVHITNLRQKLKNCDGFEIIAVRGLGYKAVLK